MWTLGIVFKLSQYTVFTVTVIIIYYTGLEAQFADPVTLTCATGFGTHRVFLSFVESQARKASRPAWFFKSFAA